MHRAARGGDSKVVDFPNIWERFVEQNQWKYMEALIAEREEETFALRI